MVPNMDTSSVQENNSMERRTTQERKLCYRNLLDKVEAINESEDLGLQTVQEIGGIIKEVNSLETECNINQRIEHADETLLSSLVLSSTSELLVKCTEAVDVFTVTYDPADFANKIKQFVNEVDDDDDNHEENETKPTGCLKLLKTANKLIPELPEYRYVYGAYDLSRVPEPKQRKERQKRDEQRERVEKRQPEKVTTVQSDEQGIDEIVKVMHEVLTQAFRENGEEPVNYYDYIIDTESFKNTVENMFYCSFLIRDGKAHITIDGRGNPFIKPVRKRALKAFREEGGTSSQMISTINCAQWEKFTKEGYLQRYKKTTAN